MEVALSKHYNIVNNEPLQFSNGPCAGKDGTRRLKGKLDDIRIYNRALSTSEIQELFDPVPVKRISVKGTITSADTGEGISNANISFNQGAYVLSTASDGTFSSTEIPVGTYQVEISAVNHFAKTISNVTLSTGMITDLSAALTPKSPVIVSTGATPGEVYNDGATTTLLTAKVTDPDGPRRYFIG